MNVTTPFFCFFSRFKKGKLFPIEKTPRVLAPANPRPAVINTLAPSRLSPPRAERDIPSIIRLAFQNLLRRQQHQRQHSTAMAAAAAGSKALAILAVLAVAAVSAVSAADAPAPSPVSAAGAAGAPLAAAIVSSAAAFLFAAVRH
ncbi:hypothetical protein ABZP36_015053 [Zizania latifolia]